MKKIKLFPINLSLFGDEAADAVSEEALSNEEYTEDEASNDGNRRRSESEPKVVYGVQEESSPEKTENTDGTEKAPKLSLDEQFEAMIKGDFKEAYDKKIQSHIKHRIGDVKKLESENSDMRAVLKVLAERYGTDSPKELLGKLEGDKGIWEEAAYEAGLTVDQFRSLKQAERQRDEYRQELENRNREAEARRVYEGWLSEAQGVKQSYPEFNLSEELKNPDFRGLIQNNIPMKKAYETIHFDELMRGVSEFSAKRAEENAVLSIKNRQNRPKESIGAIGSGVIIKDDPSKLTSKDRAEIIKRVQRGEKISF